MSPIAFPLLAVAALGCPGHETEIGFDAGEPIGVEGECEITDMFELDTPHQTTSDWDPERDVVVGVWNTCIDRPPLLDNAWREAILSVVSISNATSGEAILFEPKQSPMSRRTWLQPDTPLMQNEAYQIKVMPGSAQTAVKDLQVQSTFGDGKVTDAECTFIYTQSRPVIAEVYTFVSENGDMRVDFIFSEYVRRDMMTGVWAPQLLVDGIDRTTCQGPPSCCISENRCEQGGGSVQVGDETVVADAWSYFVVPAEIISSFGTLELRVVAIARGSKAAFADAIDGIENAKLDGDRVVWTFDRSEFKGHGKHLRWNLPCK